jgi:hypothetical protein
MQHRVQLSELAAHLLPLQDRRALDIGLALRNIFLAG